MILLVHRKRFIFSVEVAWQLLFCLILVVLRTYMWKRKQIASSLIYQFVYGTVTCSYLSFLNSKWEWNYRRVTNREKRKSMKWLCKFMIILVVKTLLYLRTIHTFVISKATYRLEYKKHKTGLIYFQMWNILIMSAGIL